MEKQYLAIDNWDGEHALGDKKTICETLEAWVYEGVPPKCIQVFITSEITFKIETKVIVED
jgi:hypothetical protein